MTLVQRNRLVALLVTVVILAVVLIFFGPFFILTEGQQAIIVRFGQIVDVRQDAGIGFKLPFIDTVSIYTRKIINWDGDPLKMLTSEKQEVWVDSTARWRIKDPKVFYSKLISIESANSRLTAVLESAVRTVVAENSLSAVVRSSNIINESNYATGNLVTAESGDETSLVTKELKNLIDTAERYQNLTSAEGRRNLSLRMYDSAKTILDTLGIELIDVLVRQIRYSDQVTQNVYDRMISERNRIAQAYRSVGEGRKKELEGQMENEVKNILSDAYRQSETIKGTADARASRIYSDAYRQDSDFFQFWRAMESYRKTLANFDKTMSTDSDYFRYLYSVSGR